MMFPFGAGEGRSPMLEPAETGAAPDGLVMSPFPLGTREVVPAPRMEPIHWLPSPVSSSEDGSVVLGFRPIDPLSLFISAAVVAGSRCTTGASGLGMPSLDPP